MESNRQIWVVFRVESRGFDGGLDVDRDRERGDKRYF